MTPRIFVALAVMFVAAAAYFYFGLSARGAPAYPPREGSDYQMEVAAE